MAQHVQADSFRVFAGVAAAFHRIVLLQGTTQIKLREDHPITVAKTNALQFGRARRRVDFNGSPGRPGCGSRRMTVVRSEPPYLFVQIGSRGEMFSKGFLGKMMPISRRNDSAKAWLPQIASANNTPPRRTYSRKACRSPSIRWKALRRA